MLPAIRRGSKGWRHVRSPWPRAAAANRIVSAAVIAAVRAAPRRTFIGKNYMLRLPSRLDCAMMDGPMGQLKRRGAPLKGQELITLAQKLARDAERHAILSA